MTVSLICPHECSSLLEVETEFSGGGCENRVHANLVKRGKGFLMPCVKYRLSSAP